jgi:hypothetical protein
MRINLIGRNPGRRHPVKRMAALVLAVSGALDAFAQTGEVASAPRIIVVGVDGLSVDGIDRASTPRLHKLMERGAWTLAARGVMPTLSSPNWESIIGGAPPELHGITSNGYLRHMVEFEPVCQDRDGKFPTIFGVLRQQQPHSRIAIFHDWRGFADLVERRAPHRRSRKRHAARPLGAAVNRYAEH